MYVLTSVCVSVQVIKLERAIKVEGVVLNGQRRGAYLMRLFRWQWFCLCVLLLCTNVLVQEEKSFGEIFMT